MALTAGALARRTKLHANAFGQRTAGAYRRLATLMANRVRDFTRGGYKEQVRGYIRNARAVK